MLDLSPIPSGSTASQALANTIDLARHADALGLTRYWLAEHHNAASLASSAPEIMIGQIAAATRGIRVGAGGIMLPNHSALRVAELFRVLSALFPGRVDLALGRAAGTDPRTAFALRRGQRSETAEAFPAQLEELVGYLAGGGAPRPPRHASIVAIPTGVPSPELFVLGSSDVGGEIAALAGMGFAFAHHMNPDDAARVLRRYRASFVPSPHRAAPHAIVSASVVCAETDGAAEELAASLDLSMVRFAQGQRDLPFPSVAEARATRYDADEEARRVAYRARHVVGGPARVGAALRAIAEACDADEVMILTHTHDHGARRRSYALVADALGVAPRG